MAKKERQKRSARKARQKERAEREELQAAQASQESAKGGKASKAVATTSKAQAPKKADKAKTGKKPGPIARMKNYFRDVKSELHRVVWPGKEELRNYSLAVIAMLVVFGVAVWLVDTGVLALLAGYTGLRG